ncbi:MAG: rane-associated lipoprotein involved in thiamine biosynthesis [Planctomycetota bacterium]|nr:rane-associated lipoprotein involved in thiamine biosynthesis [Planctomycetota bacterium]
MIHPLRTVASAMCALIVSNAVCDAEQFSFHHENVMGTSLELRIRADSADAARWAEGRVLQEIDRLSAIFSGYDRTSEFSRWMAAPKGAVKVSPELLEILQASDLWRSRSDGAFDPGVEVHSQLWKTCAKQDRVPTADELARARASMSAPAWRLDPIARTAERLSDGPISLNAIAKGFILERACDVAMETNRGVRGLLLNVGGDMRVCGDMTQTFAIANPAADSESSAPLAHARVRDRAVATSGHSQRGFRVQGRWYSHILDPRTGAPVDSIASATVVAGRSADADALATIFNVLSTEESLRLAKAIPGVECLIVTTDGRIAKSDGWHAFEIARPLTLALADGPKAADPKPQSELWPDGLEMLINYEINQPEGANLRRYRRPYVAVWVEDKDGKIVRNLILWVSFGGQGHERWLPDMRRWYKSEKARKLADPDPIAEPVARPTRQPGKYSVIWDGKDDHGKPVPRGEYVISIDAAREHGTYQNIRKQVTIATTPFAEELKGNVEIKSASIEYRRKTPAKK